MKLDTYSNSHSDKLFECKHTKIALFISLVIRVLAAKWALPNKHFYLIFSKNNRSQCWLEKSELKLIESLALVLLHFSNQPNILLYSSHFMWHQFIFNKIWKYALKSNFEWLTKNVIAFNPISFLGNANVPTQHKIIMNRCHRCLQCYYLVKLCNHFVSTFAEENGWERFIFRFLLLPFLWSSF